MTNKKPDLYNIEQALIEKYPAQFKVYFRY